MNCAKTQNGQTGFFFRVSKRALLARARRRDLGIRRQIPPTGERTETGEREIDRRRERIGRDEGGGGISFQTFFVLP